jgi:hypothetical protein
LVSIKTVIKGSLDASAQAFSISDFTFARVISRSVSLLCPKAVNARVKVIAILNIVFIGLCPVSLVDRACALRIHCIQAGLEQALTGD